MPHQPRVAFALPLLIVAGLVLTSCAAPVDEAATPSSETSTSTPTEESVAGDAPIVQTARKGEIVGTQEFTLHNALGTATVEIESLKVDGNIQVLTFHVTPQLEDEQSDINLYEFLGEDSFRPVLIDEENLKEYNVAHEEIVWTTWGSDSIETVAGDGETFTAWAVFAAPEDAVETFDVMIHDGYPRFLDVPVEE